MASALYIRSYSSGTFVTKTQLEISISLISRVVPELAGSLMQNIIRT